MNIVNPLISTHVLRLIPRYYPIGSCSLELYNEATKKRDIVSNIISVTDGIMSVTFNFDFVEFDKFQFKIYQGTEVVFRGKIFATSQDTENYRLTKNKYTYYE